MTDDITYISLWIIFCIEVCSGSNLISVHLFFKSGLFTSFTTARNKPQSSPSSNSTNSSTLLASSLKFWQFLRRVSAWSLLEENKLTKIRKDKPPKLLKSSHFPFLCRGQKSYGAGFSTGSKNRVGTFRNLSPEGGDNGWGRHYGVDTLHGWRG